MSAKFEYRKPESEAELQQLGRILTQCFNAPPMMESAFLNRIGIDNARVLFDRSEMVGGFGMLYLGQWYNGVSVPMVGISGVGIAPEHRGKGAAIALMQNALQELHDRNVPISVLYPATQILYRKAGYEQAGIRCTWEIPTATIQIKTKALSLFTTPLAIDQFSSMYEQQARSINGNLNRNEVIWQNLLDAKDKALYAYRIGADEGYVIFETWDDGENVNIAIRDWALLTPSAIDQFWTFLSQHRSQIETIRWKSAPIDALTLGLPEQTARVRSLDRWMLRIVDLKAAIQQRRYPASVSAELHLEVQDDWFSRNTGKFVLTIENGVGQLTKGGRGDLRIGIRDLSPLYTGLFTAYQLQQCGKLTGTDAALNAATQLFAGSPPWMPDFF